MAVSFLLKVLYFFLMQNTTGSIEVNFHYCVRLTVSCTVVSCSSAAYV